MIGLIIKDISTQVKYLLFLFILYIIFSIIPQFPGEVFLNLGIVMTALRIAYLEEKNNTLILLKTMPLKVSTIVLSKYLSELIIAIIFALTGLVIYLLGFGNLQEGIILLTVALPGILVFAGIYFLLFFKVGYIRASNYLRLLFFLFFLPLMMPPVVKCLSKVFGNFKNLGDFTLSQGLVVTFILLLIYFLTSLLSMMVLKRRENF